MPAQDVYIVGAVRSPIARGYAKGALHSSTTPVTLLAAVLKELAARTNVDVNKIEDVICGCVSPVNEQGGNIGRFAVLSAGWPVTVPSVQLNRMCGSGEQAIAFATSSIGSGNQDLVVATGVEFMSTVHMGSDFQVDMEEYQKAIPFPIMHQGQSADLIAAKYKISREELDAWSGQSHERAAEASRRGYYRREIMPVEVTRDGKTVTFDTDEGIRVPVDYAKLKKLKARFSADGVITPAHASQISDGAAAVLLCSGAKLREYGLTPRARVVATAVVGSDPVMMLDGPIAATRKVLSKANMTIDQIDRFEINEAFASVVLSWIKTLNVNTDKVNVNGGAIAHGHPLGATGCVLMTKLVHELERSNSRFGLTTMCIGFGQAVATIIERVPSGANM